MDNSSTEVKARLDVQKQKLNLKFKSQIEEIVLNFQFTFELNNMS